MTHTIYDILLIQYICILFCVLNITYLMHDDDQYDKNM